VEKKKLQGEIGCHKGNGSNKNPLKNHPKKKTISTHQIMMRKYTSYRDTCIPQPHYLYKQKRHRKATPNKTTKRNHLNPQKQQQLPPEGTQARWPTILAAATIQTTHSTLQLAVIETHNNTTETSKHGHHPAKPRPQTHHTQKNILQK
jgi:hypothetical protein